MNRLQIIVFGVSVVAFGGAYFVFNNYLGSQRKAPSSCRRPASRPTKVLVAAQDIPMGSVVNDTPVTWQDWPKDRDFRTDDRPRARSPEWPRNSRTSMTRDWFLRGEPHAARQARQGAASAATWRRFCRAACAQSRSRSTTAAIRRPAASSCPMIASMSFACIATTRRPEARGAEVIAHQTILANVRVLAIGQNVQEENGKKVVVGGNATLELDPKQAELVVYAQHTAARICIWSCAASSTAAARPRPSTIRRRTNERPDHRALRRRAAGRSLRKFPMNPQFQKGACDGRKFAGSGQGELLAVAVFCALSHGKSRARPGDPPPPSSITVARGEVKSLQLGVGRSMIVDLPEDAPGNLRRRSQGGQRDRPLGSPSIYLYARNPGRPPYSRLAPMAARSPFLKFPSDATWAN